MWLVESAGVPCASYCGTRIVSQTYRWLGHIPTGHQNGPDISPSGQIYRSPNSKFYSTPRADNDKICDLPAESFNAQLARES